MSDDLILRCAACSTAFVWTSGEQRGAAGASEQCPMCRRLAPQGNRQRGLVKWFSRAKGYGFITATDGAEVFIHKSGVTAGQPQPSAGQLVEFRVGHGSRGAQAEDAVVLQAVETSR